MKQAQRQAALLLHAMCEQDRAWALDRPPPPQRGTIETLLRELRELGIAPEPARLALAVQGDPASAEAGAGGGSVPPALDPLMSLSGPQARRLAGLLAGEPPQLVARLLRARSWPWQSELMDALGAVERGRVQERLRELAHDVAEPPGLLQALASAVWQRLQDGDAALPARDAGPASTGNGLVPWLRRHVGRWPAGAQARAGARP